MWLKWIVFGLGVVSVGISLFIAINNTRRKKLLTDRGTAWVFMAGAICVFMSQLLKFPQPTKESATREDVQEIVDAAMSEFEEAMLELIRLRQELKDTKADAEELRKELENWKNEWEAPAQAYKESADTPYEMAMVAVYEDRLNDAVNLFESSLKDDSPGTTKKAEAYLYAGMTRNLLGQTDKALEDLSAAVKLKPDYHEAWSGLGDVSAGKGDFKTAVVCYDSALKFKRDFPEVWYSRSAALDSIGDHQAAVANADSARHYDTTKVKKVKIKRTPDKIQQKVQPKKVQGMN